jgi:hypothetical protein
VLILWQPGSGLCSYYSLPAAGIHKGFGRGHRQWNICTGGGRFGIDRPSHPGPKWPRITSFVT